MFNKNIPFKYYLRLEMKSVIWIYSFTSINRLFELNQWLNKHILSKEESRQKSLFSFPLSFTTVFINGWWYRWYWGMNGRICLCLLYRFQKTFYVQLKKRSRWFCIQGIPHLHIRHLGSHLKPMDFLWRKSDMKIVVHLYRMQ